MNGSIATSASLRDQASRDSQSHDAYSTSSGTHPTTGVVVHEEVDTHVEILPEKDRCEIIFRNLSYTVDIDQVVSGRGPITRKRRAEKVILDNITGRFSSGRLTAIMGASGAGKSSLLQVLAGGVHSGHTFGEILVNGTPVDGPQMKKISGFVFQDDVILATQTVREAIAMSAVLRVPDAMSKEEKEERVDDMIRMLGLEKAAGTIIGDANMKGISGGERKRTAMAMEMITNPGVLFLDEPTSGLDTFTAYSVVKILKDLAHTGRTVVATIHQPSSDVFHMFDDLLVLAEGRIIYMGPTANIIDYFSKVGYQCPQFTNPADFLFMSILNNEEGIFDLKAKTGETNQSRIKRLLTHWNTSTENKAILSACSTPSTRGIQKSSYHKRSPLTTQFSYLFNRASKNAFRNPYIVQTKLFQNLVIGLIVGLVYLNMDERKGLAAHQDRMGLLFFLALNNFMSGTFGVLSIFGEEKMVFAREHGAGYYGLPAYFLSKVLVESPFQIVFPWMSGTIVYWMTGLQPLADKYFITMSFVVLGSLCGFALGIFFACTFANLTLALSVTPMIMLPLMLFSGLFVNQDAIPAYFNWIKYISPMKYVFEGSFKTEYTGLTLPNPTDSNQTVPGESYIRSVGFDDGITILYCALVLIGMVVFLMGTAYAALKRVTVKESRPVHIKPANKRKTSGSSAGSVAKDEVVNVVVEEK
ncbi:ATP-binding cassette sub- G member 1 [Quaeritorhiza haematococci]|nr:ATP-binding cassette sub- G member 1 [Quaeritorhiza haematococci]